MTPLQEKKQANTDHSIHDYLSYRYSPRVFEDRSIEDSTLQQLFEAARWAPSSNNYQPWRFIYGHKGTEAYDRIFNVLGEFNQSWNQGTPLLILGGYKKTFDNGKENFHALHDLGLSVANLTFQAETMGIAVHQMAGVDWEKAHEVFDVPDDYHIATAIAVGYYGGDVSDLSEDLAEQEKAARTRHPQKDFVFHGDWGK